MILRWFFNTCCWLGLHDLRATPSHLNDLPARCKHCGRRFEFDDRRNEWIEVADHA